MPYANAAERKAHVKAKRLADPEFNAQYLAKRRAQKARARIRKREAKPPRIPKPYCAHGHPRTANNLTPHGACKECRRAYKKRVRDAKPKAVRIHSPKPTRAQVRERERIHEAKRLGQSVVLPWADYLVAKAASALSPEERQRRHKVSQRKNLDKLKAKRLEGKWYAGLTHEEKFLIGALSSLVKKNEYNKAYAVKKRKEDPVFRDKANARSKAYSKTKTGLEKARARKHKREANKRGNGGSFSAQEWSHLKSIHGKCLGCGLAEAEILSLGRKLVPDHVRPLVKGGTSNIDNIQPLCHGVGGCNNHKSARWIDYRPGFPLEIT